MQGYADVSLIFYVHRYPLCRALVHMTKLDRGGFLSLPFRLWISWWLVMTASQRARQIAVAKNQGGLTISCARQDP